MSRRALLYGVTGYTGREVAARLKGQSLIVAGRDPAKVRAVAEPLGLEWRAFPLTDTDLLQASLADVDVVLHAAGPFLETGKPMLDACLAMRTHYLDLSGEWPVFLDAMARDAEIKAAGIMVVPGVGLTIAATDCLLALAVRRWPDTVRILLGVSRAQIVTRGTAISAAQLLSPDVLVRRNGELAAEPAGRRVHVFDFGCGLRDAVAISWPDVVTGEFTTGVANIETFSEIEWPMRAAYCALGMAMTVTGSGIWRMTSQAMAKAWPEGPSAEVRRRARFTMVAEALDPWRRTRRLEMRTLDGYTASVLSAAAAVERVLDGNWSCGFQTPSRAFGPEFIIEAGAAVLQQTSRTAVAA